MMARFLMNLVPTLMMLPPISPSRLLTLDMWRRIGSWQMVNHSQAVGALSSSLVWRIDSVDVEIGRREVFAAPIAPRTAGTV